MRERNWTPEQISGLSLHNIRILFMSEDDAKMTVKQSEPPRTKMGRRFIEERAEKAARNIMSGMRWDA